MAPSHASDHPGGARYRSTPCLSGRPQLPEWSVGVQQALCRYEKLYFSYLDRGYPLKNSYPHSRNVRNMTHIGGTPDTGVISPCVAASKIFFGEWNRR